MSYFSENKITPQGLALLAKCQIGEPLNYTRIVLGDGYIDFSEEAITDLISPRHEIYLTKCDVEDGKIVVGGPLILENIEEEFYYREIGLYAKGLDEIEILYSYGNAGDIAELISPNKSSIIERFIEIVAVIDNASNINVILDSNMFANLEDLNRKVDKMEGMGLSSNDYTALEKEKLSGIDEGANNYLHPTVHPASMIQTDSEHRFITDEQIEHFSQGGSGGGVEYLGRNVKTIIQMYSPPFDESCGVDIIMPPLECLSYIFHFNSMPEEGQSFKFIISTSEFYYYSLHPEEPIYMTIGSDIANRIPIELSDMGNSSSQNIATLFYNDELIYMTMEARRRNSRPTFMVHSGNASISQSVVQSWFSSWINSVTINGGSYS